MKTQLVEGTNLMAVGFLWNTDHGECQDCGLPAAFFSPFRYHVRAEREDRNKLCCVCAANDAAEGMTIERIEEI